MTEKKDINLTAEEQAQIAEEKPTLLEALKTGHPAAKGWLVAWRRKQSAIEEARNQADKIQQEVAAAVDLKQGNLLRWCGYPTDMTRCSPFFPFNAKELGHREFLRDFVITSANWGQITYTGPQLSIYEEDALMVLLALLEQVSQNREVAKVEGMRRTYTYKGPALPLLRLLGHKQPSKREYVRLIAALKLMVVAGIEMSISAGKTKSGKKRAPRFIHIVNMLSNVFWDEEKKELSATINPYFYEAYRLQAHRPVHGARIDVNYSEALRNAFCDRALACAGGTVYRYRKNAHNKLLYICRAAAVPAAAPVE